MRIVIVVAATGAGGAERVIALLANAWIDRGWDVSIVCFEPPGTVPYYAMPSKVRLVQDPDAKRSKSGLATALAMLRRVGFIRRALISEHPDVVVSFLTKINVLTLAAGRGLAFPILICERNNLERQSVRSVWRYLQERLGRRATLILQTEASRKAFRAPMRENAIVIPNPVQESSFQAGSERRMIVAVGRLVAQKGFDLLLQAFSRQAAAFPDWNVVIWGEGPERANLERLRDDLGLQGRVEFPGITAEPGTWVTSASIFALSSRYEGFPNVLIEAMSAGLAVASFDCPWGPSEIISPGNDGLLVAPENVAALGEALASLMESPDKRKRLGDNARLSVRRYALVNVLANWEAAFERAKIARSKSRP